MLGVGAQRRGTPDAGDNKFRVRHRGARRGGGEADEEGPEEGPVDAAAVLGRSERASVTRSAESRPQVSSVAPSTLTETLVICAEWRCLTSETRFPDFGSLLRDLKSFE